MKYGTQQQLAAAVYESDPTRNPFLSAMPPMMTEQDFWNALTSTPPIPAGLSQMTTVERRQSLPLLSSLFFPMSYMYAIYDQLYRAIVTTYTTRTTVETIRRTNTLFCGLERQPYATQADTGSILGVPGIGKTSTIRRCLATMPQVIEHMEYQGQPFYCKQVLYLHIECPSDCSVKTLALNLVAALDRAIGSNYLDQLTSLRSVAASAVATQVKILCMTHHVGLILVDEIQNAVVTAQKNKQVKPLMKFLVELTNDTCTSVYFVGTPLAEELFTSEEHLKRRTRGIRLLPLRPDGTYRAFLEQLWPYQLTPQTAPLTDKLANKLYDWSGGIPAYIVKIFQEAQVQALLQGGGCINEKLVQRAIDILAIKVPKTYSGGTSISNFQSGVPDIPTDEISVSEERDVPRMYANKRGRKAVRRDAEDLLAAYQEGKDMVVYLTACGLLERFPPC